MNYKGYNYGYKYGYGNYAGSYGEYYDDTPPTKPWLIRNIEKFMKKNQNKT